MQIRKRRTPRDMERGDYYNGKYGRMISCPECGNCVSIRDYQLKPESTAKVISTAILSCGCPNRHYFRVISNTIDLT